MNERDENILLNIKDEAEILLEMTAGKELQDFLTNEMMKRAVSMSLINIGEYVKKLSGDLKQAHLDVRWESITNLRNIAAHNYEGLRMGWIWKNVTDDVPKLLEQVKNILDVEKVEREE